MKIKLINRKNIDDKRWNGCIHFAINALPYAYTWYLDNVCENWEGLVLDNYKAVMPLVYKKKFGISLFATLLVSTTLIVCILISGVSYTIV